MSTRGTVSTVIAAASATCLAGVAIERLRPAFAVNQPGSVHSHRLESNPSIASPIEAAAADSTSFDGNAELAACGAAVGMASLAAFLRGPLRGKKATSKKDLVALNAFESELGVQAPVGFWDPLGLSSDGDAETFRRRRITELKHGRVSMLACMGYITPEYFKWPGLLAPSSGLKFADVPNGLAALEKVPVNGWLQIVIFAGFYEFPTYNSDRAPGDLGWKALTSSDPETLKKKLNAELANGRLAMMAIMGMLYQDGLTGSAWGDWALYTDSPLRAFESELGVQPPVGFWDPLGFTKDGDAVRFRRRRTLELKHGRVSMIAAIGYIVPEYYKFEGELSPSNGIQFADVPNGLAALSKVPASGIAQIISFAGFCELFLLTDDPKRAPGDFEKAGVLGNPFGLGSLAPEAKAKKLSAELANGRLAMVSIIGMFFQDGYTGSAWGDWSLYTDSPLRAFESELGVQPPVGFWDPLGLANDGDAVVFARRRETELKHGRICMLACIGYIVPEYFKWPGFLSPQLGLQFEDIPNGLAAFAKVPGGGWAQIVAFLGIYELFINKPTGEPGNYNKGSLGAGFLPSISDPEARKKKLSAELANGRLAMVAIIGMLFQDGLTGSAWGDWALYTDSPLRAFEGELGVQAPVGYWDPLGLSADGDIATFKRRRETEIKHGRVAMYATLGYIVPEFYKFPGALSPSLGLNFSAVPNGLKACSAVPSEGWFQIILFAGCFEVGWGYNKYATGGTPGDYGWKVLSSDDPAQLKRKLNAELANGRLAMMAIIGMFYQDGLTGSAWGDWSLYTDSPIRAFESELGVQAPVGFWDPLGFTKDGDVDTFKRRREVELKHGRVSMFATIGYFVPEYFKWPGFLSPSAGLAFKDVPNGLAAFSKVPFLGWTQIVLFCGLVDFGLYRADPSRDPGDYENAGVLGVPNASGPMSDVEGRKTKLNAELANGRLAMVAILGMFFQNGTFGTTGPVMWAFASAFENELGVQAPLGFWDPLGFSKDGNVRSFLRRRSVEIKHGRICMLATMGYITPEITGKFPGPLAPGTGLNFEDVPNGLAALSKVPLGGWAQMIAYCGFCEAKGGYDNDVTSGKPGDMGWKPPLLAGGDAETKKRRLNAEIANGRLAMVAIIGMFFQDGLTGAAWGDWANYTDSPLR